MMNDDNGCVALPYQVREPVKCWPMFLSACESILKLPYHQVAARRAILPPVLYLR